MMLSPLYTLQKQLIVFTFFKYKKSKYREPFRLCLALCKVL